MPHVAQVRWVFWAKPSLDRSVGTRREHTVRPETITSFALERAGPVLCQTFLLEWFALRLIPEVSSAGRAASRVSRHAYKSAEVRIWIPGTSFEIRYNSVLTAHTNFMKGSSPLLGIVFLALQPCASWTTACRPQRPSLHSCSIDLRCTMLRMAEIITKEFLKPFPFVILCGNSCSHMQSVSAYIRN